MMSENVEVENTAEKSLEPKDGAHKPIVETINVAVKSAHTSERNDFPKQKYCQSPTEEETDDTDSIEYASAEEGKTSPNPKAFNLDPGSKFEASDKKVGGASIAMAQPTVNDEMTGEVQNKDDLHSRESVFPEPSTSSAAKDSGIPQKEQIIVTE